MPFQYSYDFITSIYPGWRDVQIIAYFRADVTKYRFEIQLHLKKIFECRNLLGGLKLYATYRSLLEALEVVFGSVVVSQLLEINPPIEGDENLVSNFSESTKVRSSFTETKSIESRDNGNISEENNNQDRRKINSAKIQLASSKTFTAGPKSIFKVNKYPRRHDKKDFAINDRGII